MKKLILAVAMAVVAVAGAVWYMRGGDTVPGPNGTNPDSVVTDPNPVVGECGLDLSKEVAPEGWSYHVAEPFCLGLALPADWELFSAYDFEVSYGDPVEPNTYVVVRTTAAGHEGYALIDGDNSNDAMPGFTYHEFAKSFELGGGDTVWVVLGTRTDFMTESEFLSLAESIMENIKN